VGACREACGAYESRGDRYTGIVMELCESLAESMTEGGREGGEVEIEDADSEGRLQLKGSDRERRSHLPTRKVGGRRVAGGWQAGGGTQRRDFGRSHAKGRWRMGDCGVEHLLVR
jgi:hypothetical protein